MREILFRGRCTDVSCYEESLSEFTIGDWVKGNYVCLNGEIHKIMTGSSLAEFYIFDIDPKTLGQYTGLKDKNGKKIFEGDIISAYLDGHYSESKYEARYTVVYKNCAFRGKTGDYYYFCLDENVINEFEIIGNIYDNPELSENSDNSCHAAP